MVKRPTSAAGFFALNPGSSVQGLPPRTRNRRYRSIARPERASCPRRRRLRTTRRCEEGYTPRSHRAYPRLTRITRTSGNGGVDSERTEQSSIEVGVGEIVASPEALQMGSRLDKNHVPETNGRMSVCRRCGARTDGPKGFHIPDERQLERALRWLDGQSLSSGIDRAKSRLNS